MHSMRTKGQTAQLSASAMVILSIYAERSVVTLYTMTSYPAGGCRSVAGHLDRASEHPAIVPTPAHDGPVSGMPVGEGHEALVRMDVVHQHDPAYPHDRGRLLHLEQRVLARVQAVMDEHLQVADLGNQRGQALLARALQVRPARATRLGHGYPGLRVQPMVERKRKVDAPQVAQLVLPQCLEDDP